MDKDYREPATAATCFTKKEGFFLPQNDILFEPVFKEAYKDKVSYFVITPVVIADFVTELGEQRGTGGFGSTGK